MSRFSEDKSLPRELDNYRFSALMAAISGLALIVLELFSRTAHRAVVQMELEMILEMSWNLKEKKNCSQDSHTDTI